MACRFGTDQHFPLFFRAEPEAFFQGAIDIRIFEIPFEVSLFGAHLEFKSAVFRAAPENWSPLPPLEFKSAVFRICLETSWKY